eukprot:CAMPEP_0168620470 /NCGR_PEP_ID=MMETSP0449_2-20121227/7153_1 /TAXON_ID=1082188 /ORGANISM="Strombidium rassoulzadegani, Strain ras09" /LENGTH=155 /DNA_ID=CAMNT_0008661475 /DNA_START=208 /DNA_END=678 /DNA_ORIENTATION=-
MGILLVYDCTEEVTFNNIQNWLKQIEQHAVPTVKKVLVANKVDRPENEIKVDVARGQALADQHGLASSRPAAKSGYNVNEVFEHIASEIIVDFQAQGIQTNNSRALGGKLNGQQMTNHSTQANDMLQYDISDNNNIRLGGMNPQDDKPAQNSGCC